MKTDRRVAYFAGCAANYYHPDVGKSTIRVLEKNGVRPMFPDQKCCGIPQLVHGNLQSFREHAEQNVRALAEADCDIVTACPSCALALKEEYPKLIGSQEADIVSGRTFDILEYLIMLHEGNDLNTLFRALDLRIVYHAPCHLKTLGEGSIERRLQLLRLIPGISVDRIERGCCGMGGTFGSKASTYSVSMAIGQPLFEALEEAAPDRICTECPACTWQIEQGTQLQVMHPIRILEEAYEPVDN